MLEITNLRQGAVMNHNHGKETADSLEITVSGIADGGYPVKVNGTPAEMDGRSFTATISLTKKINTVKAEAITPYGNFSQELTIVWDKKSFRRCNFYIDDHSFLFTDLAQQRPKHAFDHFYLAGLKKIHDKYGFKVTLNSFYHNDHHEFVLKDVPDIWKSEFIDNSDWLKFSFHAYSEFPDRPYLESTAEEFGRDWELVQNEIVRFAGEQSFIAPCVIHWANIHPAVALEAVRRGMTCYSSNMRARVMGGPSLADRQKGGDMATVEKRSVSGDDMRAETIGLKLHYETMEENSYIAKHGAYYDPLIGIFFFSTKGACCNLTPLDKIAGIYEKVFEQRGKVGCEIFGGASHEQYTFPYYGNYIPDHLQRIEEACRCLIDVGGCKPVFFSNGLLGNTAWEK